MKKTVFSLYALVGYLIFSFPVLAMLDEDEERRAYIHQQTIGNPDIVPYFVAFLDTPALVTASRLCHMWKDCVFSEPLLKQQQGKVLSFLNERTYGESFTSLISGISIADPNATISLSLLDDIWTENKNLFPIDAGTAHERAKYRVGYSIGLICGGNIWGRHSSNRRTERDDFIIDNSLETKFSNIEHITFLSTLLKNCCVDFVFLNSAYFQPLYNITEEEACILGEGVGCSSLGSIRLKKLVFQGASKALPVFLKEAAKNPKLQVVDLSTIAYELDETVIDTLIHETPEGLPFELMFPQRLVFNGNYKGNIGDAHNLREARNLAARNAALQGALTAHFGDKVKFAEQ
jgi:hypothetical protein